MTSNSGFIKVIDMKCEVCAKTLHDTGSLIRQNKGEMPARWRCLEHDYSEIDVEVSDIIKAINPDNKGFNG